MSDFRERQDESRHDAMSAEPEGMVRELSHAKDSQVLSRERCANCGVSLEMPGWSMYSLLVGVEYPHDHPGHYDGISEWRCPACGFREGRWTGRTLVGDDYERPSARQEGATRW